MRSRYQGTRTLLLAITMLARMAMWSSIFAGGDRDRNPIGLIATIVLAPVAALVLQMAVSRGREYEADRTGAGLVGSGEPLALALAKLDAYATRVPSQVAPEQAQAYIVNPLRGRRDVSFRNMFSTHPPVEERIRRLRDEV